MFTRLIILFIFMIIIDIINHFGLKFMLRRIKESYLYKYNFIAYWGIAISIVVVFLVSMGITGYPKMDYVKYRVYFFLFGFWLIFYFPRIVFALFVILQAIYYLIKSIFSRRSSYAVKRKKQKKYLIQKLGLVVSIFTSFLVIYGMVWGKSNYKVQTIDISIQNLPKAFDGFTIAQFSDAHFGSFTNIKDAHKGLDMMQNENPDLIVFTGDMVNNIADEIEPFFADLSKLDAPYGKFSILGNHDMSDYVKWKDFEMKQEYLKKLISYEEKCGFKVLLNQNFILRKGHDSIALIGVENWGVPPFKQYGNLDKAIKGVETVPVKILLSHDPSHWENKVINKTDIAITLSGHTHGMQMGIDFWGMRWSPVQYLYKQWFGLYNEGTQYLYVNPGFGFLAFPGRIGIQPEITIIKLHSKS